MPNPLSIFLMELVGSLDKLSFTFINFSFLSFFHLSSTRSKTFSISIQFDDSGFLFPTRQKYFLYCQIFILTIRAMSVYSW